MFALSSATMAQEDDMYFTTRKDKKEKTSETKVKTHTVEVIYEDEESEPQAYSSRITAVAPTSATRDVDEYNRRGRTPSSSVDTVSASSPATSADTRTKETYELSAQSLYDLGYDEGYTQGFSDAGTIDYYYGVRLARFHGRHFHDPWYWNRVSYIYDPWFWDPWYYDPWYRPYYYGGWYSVGWGVGYYGSYWYPYHHYYPYHHHHHYWGHGRPHSHGPRYSTSRNYDYGRSRIVDRSYRAGDSNRNVSRSNDRTSVNRSDGRYSGSSNRATRYNERANSRSNRVTDRSSSRSTRVTDRTSTRTTDRTSRTDRTSSVNRSSSRSTSSSSTRVGSSSSHSRNSGIGSRSGGGVRSIGGSRGGRGR